MDPKTQQFIQKSKQAGYTDEQISAFLKQKGIDISQQTSPQNIQTDKFQIQTSGTGPVMQAKPKREISGGFLGYLAPAVASVPQAIGRKAGEFVTKEAAEGVALRSQTAADTMTSLRKQIDRETNPVKKDKLKALARELASGSLKDYQESKAITSGDWITKQTEIDLGILGKFPGLEEGGAGIQQIAGRSVRQAGVAGAPMLGPAGAGAFFGAGTAMERGEDAMGVLTESAKMAVLFKVGGWALGKAINTPLGQRIITAPLGSTVLGISQKITSPFIAKAAVAGTPGAVVDQVAKNIGGYVDRLVSPSTYTRPVGGVLRTVGEKTGVLPSGEEKVANAKGKIENYWEGVKGSDKGLIKNDTNSPKFLADEGVIPEVKNGRMRTSAQADLVGQKANAEHRVLNNILKESGGNISVNDLRSQAEAQINANPNLQGLERRQAIQYFNKQYNALLDDVSASLTTTKDGISKMPLDKVNDIKIYMWNRGFPSKLAPASESVNAEAMRSAGNAFKNSILSEAEKLSPDIYNAVTTLNKHTGELLQAKNFLETVNGSPVKSGRLGGYFTKLYMTMLGSSAGPVGAAAGYLGADTITAMMQNPSIKLGNAVKIISAANKANPGALEQAIKTLNGITPPTQ